MLNITDLNTTRELAAQDMSQVRGGMSDFERFAALLDFSTSIDNRVADVQQAFGLSIAQGNSGTVANQQTIIGGNGVTFAPVTQTLEQSNQLSIADLGRVLVG